MGTPDNKRGPRTPEQLQALRAKRLLGFINHIQKNIADGSEFVSLKPENLLSADSFLVGFITNAVDFIARGRNRRLISPEEREEYKSVSNYYYGFSGHEPREACKK